MAFYFLDAHRPLESSLRRNRPHRPAVFLYFENHLRQTVAASKQTLNKNTFDLTASRYSATIISRPFYYFHSVSTNSKVHDRVYNGHVTAVRTGRAGNASRVYEQYNLRIEIAKPSFFTTFQK